MSLQHLFWRTRRFMPSPGRHFSESTRSQCGWRRRNQAGTRTKLASTKAIAVIKKRSL